MFVFICLHTLFPLAMWLRSTDRSQCAFKLSKQFISTRCFVANGESTINSNGSMVDDVELKAQSKQ